ncbi:MAG: EAL domain-containing protein [Leclercia sp.]
MMYISWDPILIGVSYLVAFIASFVALDSAGKILLANQRASLFWRLAGGITLGMGIWSMHFIGMLAMRMPMMMSYDLWLTITSFAISLVATTLAINIAVSGTSLSVPRLLVATVILSAGVVTMHYVGMSALMGHGAIHWDMPIVLLSIVISIIASCVGLWLAFHLRHNHKGAVMNRIVAALVIGAAVCAMHYTGMAAADFHAGHHAASGGVSEMGLSIWVSSTTLLLLGIMLIISLVDSHNRTSRLTENLRQLNNQLEIQARYDALTGLANRHQMGVLLQDGLRQAKASRTRFALIFLDLDRFKSVNDTWGHFVGDELLIHVVQRISARLAPNMTLARMGGDEFVILGPECSEAQIKAICTTLVNDIGQPFYLYEHTLNISLSAGISFYPDHGEDLHELKLKADTAMYNVKHEGRNGWAIYHSEMSQVVSATPALLQDLSQALARQQFEVWYQPKYYAQRNEIVGFEALLRWRHPQQGVLLPDSFLPALAKTGLIIAVGNWMIDHACQQLQSWEQSGHPWTLSINISPIQFEQPDIYSVITEALRKYTVSPSRLTLEVTESSALKNLTRSVELLNAFCKDGITVSIDDFGTGYSNMLMLNTLPAKELKIDKSFIKNISHSETSVNVVATIINVARSMNMNVVAEGIETEEQLALLTRLGCGYLQGYLFSRPIPAEHIYLLTGETPTGNKTIPAGKINTNYTFVSQKNPA